MKLLDRYLLAQYIKYFFTINAAFASLYVLIDFFEKIDNFNDAGKTALALKYFIFNLPFVADQLSPILILLSGVITLGILSHNHELTALKAGGLPLITIIRPIILAGLGFTLLFLAAAQWLLPNTVAATNHIWFEQVKGKIQLGIHRNGRYYFKGREGFYSFKWADQKQMAFKDFSYAKWTDGHQLEMLLAAKTAYFKNGTWLMFNGQTQMLKDGEFTAVPFKKLKQNLPEKPEDFFIPQYDFSDLSITELFAEIHRQETEEETIKARADFYGRISYLTLGFPLLLMGLPILLLTYAKWGRDLSIAIPISCGMAFVAWGIWGAMQSLAGAGAASPLLAAGIIHIIIFLSSSYLLYRYNR
ncbi:MAG: permease [Deltaproteobacteria bacterium]|nr:MAG: permease [Deltaproteobacteria bacterium]